VDGVIFLPGCCCLKAARRRQNAEAVGQGSAPRSTIGTFCATTLNKSLTVPHLSASALVIVIRNARSTRRTTSTLSRSGTKISAMGQTLKQNE
jgi:hypothetical protein